MRKRTLSLALAVSMAAMSLAGCGGGGTTATTAAAGGETTAAASEAVKSHIVIKKPPLFYVPNGINVNTLSLVIA